MIGWLDNGTVAGEFASSMANLAAYEVTQQRLFGVLRVPWGPMLPEGRNHLVQRFLETEADWLLMVDSDMVFPHTSVEILLSTADGQTAPVVGGLCFGANLEFGQFPTLYRNFDDRPHVWFDYPRNQVVEVDATGSAFVLTHRSVYEDHQYSNEWPWYHRRHVFGTKEKPDAYLGEDISWCWWLREKGVPIYVNTSLKVGHVKTAKLDEDSYDRVRS